MPRITGSEISACFHSPIEITTGCRNPDLHYLSTNAGIRRIIKYIIHRSKLGITLSQHNGARGLDKQPLLNGKPINSLESQLTLDGQSIDSITLSRAQIRWRRSPGLRRVAVK